MTAYLNGQFLPLTEARVPALDRGFLFGDGAYEVIPVYSRRPFRLDEHLRRLDATLASMRLTNPHSLDEWRALVLELVHRNPWNDQSIYLQITRGADVRRHHAFPDGVSPTVFLMAEALITPDDATRQRGVNTVSATDIRWLRCDMKSTSLLANCLLRQLAADAGAAETILFRDGILTEGSASSVFVVRNGTLMAPPKTHLMLPGITYDVVFELAAANGLPTEVRDLTEDEVRSADEVWITSSTKEVLPVAQLDGKPIANGQPGPLAVQMMGWYQDFKREVMRGQG